MHKFLALFDMCLFYDWPFLQENLLFPLKFLAQFSATMSSFTVHSAYFCRFSSSDIVVSHISKANTAVTKVRMLEPGTLK